jgi:hypothetical protein
MKYETMKATALPAIGALFGGGLFAGLIVLPGTDIKFALIDGGAAGDIEGEWGEYGQDIPDCGSFWDGLSNTNAMAEAGSKLARDIRALTLRSHSDWQIPARDQLEVLYRNLKPTADKNWCSYLDGYNAHSDTPGTIYTKDYPAQTASEQHRSDGTEALQPAVYWCSTQCSARTAFIQTFEDGNQDLSGKTNKFRARAVRMIQLVIE